MERGRYLILFYDYVGDIAERRGEHRPMHLELVGRYKADGHVVAGGALGDPITGAALVFATQDESVGSWTRTRT